MEHLYSTPIDLAVDADWGAIEVGPDGTSLHGIAYVGGNGIYYYRSDDEGKTWNTPVLVDANGVNNVLEHPLVVTDNGVIVVFYETSSAFAMSRSTNDGVSWSSPTTIAAKGSGQFFRTGLGKNGETIHLAYALINDGVTEPFWRGTMYYRKSTDAGANWSTAVEPYPNGGTYESASRPDLCVNGNIIHLAWAALRTGDTILQDEEIVTGRSIDGGSTWETIVVHKNNTATHAHRPDIITNSNGIVILVWQEELDGGGPSEIDLRLKRSSDSGNSWGSIVRMTNATLRAEHVYMAFGVNPDHVAMVWANYVAEPDGHPYARYSEDAGITWAPEEVISDTYLVGAPTMAFSTNFVHVITLDVVNNFIQASRTWFDVTDPAETNLMEDFEGNAAGPPPNANWANGVLTTVSDEGIVRDGSGRGARKSDGGYRQGSHWSASTYGPDADVVLELDSLLTVGEGVHFGLGYVFGANALDAYGIAVDRTATDEYSFSIWAITDSSVDSISSRTETLTVASGDKIALQKRGELLRALHKPSAGAWSIFAEITDDLYATLEGYPYLEFTADQACRIRNMWATTFVESQPELQQLRPDADITTTGWATAPLFSKINDESDATVITATAS